MVRVDEKEVLLVSEEAATGEENYELEIEGGDDHEHEATAAAAEVVSGGGGGDFRAKRKRGRPRKHPVEMPRELTATIEIPEITQKRGRGRPKGTGKWQTLAASLGCNGEGDTDGSIFRPQVITVPEGENIVERIWSFSEMTPDHSICILAASGIISTAQLYVPASSGCVLTHKGQLSIVFLNGSHTYDEKRGAKIRFLSVQLAYPDGRICGGAVAGSLIAAAPTLVIIARFRQNKWQKVSSSNGGVATSPLMQQGENGKVTDC